MWRVTRWQLWPFLFCRDLKKNKKKQTKNKRACPPSIRLPLLGWILQQYNRIKGSFSDTQVGWKQTSLGRLSVASLQSWEDLRSDSVATVILHVCTFWGTSALHQTSFPHILHPTPSPTCRAVTPPRSPPPSVFYYSFISNLKFPVQWNKTRMNLLMRFLLKIGFFWFRPLFFCFFVPP